jgi:hypothetical protein
MLYNDIYVMEAFHSAAAFQFMLSDPAVDGTSLCQSVYHQHRHLSQIYTVLLIYSSFSFEITHYAFDSFFRDYSCYVSMSVLAHLNARQRHQIKAQIIQLILATNLTDHFTFIKTFGRMVADARSAQAESQITPNNKYGDSLKCYLVVV